jgi:hypothetical protein
MVVAEKTLVGAVPWVPQEGCPQLAELLLLCLIQVENRTASARSPVAPTVADLADGHFLPLRVAAATLLARTLTTIDYTTLWSHGAPAKIIRRNSVFVRRNPDMRAA